MSYMVLIGIEKKEDFIFKNNELDASIGASKIIEYLIEEFYEEISKKYEGSTIIKERENIILEFKSEEKGKNFIEETSEKILRQFEGIDCYFVATQIDYKKDNAVETVRELYSLLDKKKNSKNTRQISIGIEENCQFTGLPATDKVSNKYVSQEVKIKLERAKGAYGKFEDFEDYFMDGQDEFKKNNKSYMAVIRIEGNNIENRFKKISKKYKKEIEKDRGNNKKYIKNINELSERIKEVYEFAFLSIIDERIDNLKKEEKNIGIRPIILASGELIIITRADIGIEVTKEFIKKIKEEKVEIDGEEIELNAVAGIAFVKARYPFSKAYKFAKELCENCKTEIKEKGIDTSLIDWHMVQGEQDKSLYEIRKELYNLGDLKLNMRPLYINSKDDEVRNLETLNIVFRKIKNSETARNKVKGVREAMNLGKKEFEKYISIYRLEKFFDIRGKLKSNKVSSIGLFEENKKATSIFFDAIEIMDLM
ncbi:MAG: hypothetical protein ACRC28_05420 [Clostridium sp.]|uniref:hypothetical protein n=1 Tax=Clostridium sp. TaxID=1506 RepID=UPI003F2D2955